MQFSNSGLLPNILKSGIMKQQNTFTYGGLGFYSYFSPDIFFTAKEEYNSTVIRSSDISTKESHLTSFKTGYVFNDKLSAGVLLNSSIFEDSRQSAINSSSQQYIEMFGRYSLGPENYTSLSGGYARNKQVGDSNDGFIIESEGLLKNLSLLESNLYTVWKLRQEQVNPRKNYVRKVQINFTNQFENSLANEFSTQYEEQRNDFYIPIDSYTRNDYNVKNNIQKRVERIFSFNDKISDIRFLNNFFASLSGSFFTRQVDRSYYYVSDSSYINNIYPDRIQELKFEAEGNLRYSTSVQESNFRMFYSQRDEKHQIPTKDKIPDLAFADKQASELMKNNTSDRIALVLSSRWNLSAKDKLTINLSHNKLTYDTQSQDNYDDRDELLTIARLEYERSISPFFTLFLQAEGNLNHVVYIYAEKSSNNNRNRILRLRSGGSYNGVILSSTNSFEITSNYTTFDFEDINPNYKSYSFRQFFFTDSTEYAFSSSLSGRLQSVFKVSEQGDLYWSDFSLKPTRNNEEFLFQPSLVTKIQGVEFAAGIRYYSMRTYNYSGRNKIPDTKFNSTGPTAEIKYQAGSSVNVFFSGNYEFVSHGSGIDDHRSNFQLSVAMKI
jgi:hypothetical protein